MQIPQPACCVTLEKVFASGKQHRYSSHRADFSVIVSWMQQRKKSWDKSQLFPPVLCLPALSFPLPEALLFRSLVLNTLHVLVASSKHWCPCGSASGHWQLLALLLSCSLLDNVVACGLNLVGLGGWTR